MRDKMIRNRWISPASRPRLLFVHETFNTKAYRTRGKSAHRSISSYNDQAEMKRKERINPPSRSALIPVDDSSAQQTILIEEVVESSTLSQG